MCLLSPKSCIIFDPTDGRTSTTEEMLPTEYPDEDTVSCDEFYDKMEDEDFVNCICQIQEGKRSHDTGFFRIFTLCKAIQCSFFFMRRSHLLPDQLPGQHTGGATCAQINCLGYIQVEPPPPRSTGEHTGDMAAASTFLLQQISLGKHTLFPHLPYHTLCSTTPIRYKYSGCACSESPYMLCYVHQSHTRNSTHLAFIRVGEYSGTVAFSRFGTVPSETGTILVKKVNIMLVL